MKIYIFSARGDEMDAIDNVREKLGVDIETSANPIDFEDLSAIEPGSMVSVLGMQRFGEAEFKALADRGIHYLSTRTIGYDHMDLGAARKYGVHVCNARYAPDGVADYTIMMILLCLRAYKQALWRMQINDFSLDGLIGKEIRDLTIGIVGTGRIGARVVKDLSGFGCRILVSSRHENPELKGLAEYVPLDRLYKECDVISFHLALTPETEHMINKDSLAKMKKGVILINCARGELMDMESLIEGIESEQIGALGLDTVENEAGVVHRDLKTAIFEDRELAYLRQFKNVVYTQHMAFYTEEAVESMVISSVEGLISMAKTGAGPTQLC
ncbi:MAG: NAD(P)-dependent oxidoreductase [Eubacteriales bacterium]|nr:NAD(P)-dependent oxidoreductase [Eubacteriales bacterium]